MGYHMSLLDNEQLVYEWRHERFGSHSCHWSGSREILRRTNHEKSHCRYMDLVLIRDR
jgi:hypothetical protein